MKYLLTYESYNVSVASVRYFTDTPVSDGGDATASAVEEPFKYKVKNVKNRRLNSLRRRRKEIENEKEKEKENVKKQNQFLKAGMKTIDDMHGLDVDKRPGK